MTHPKQPQPTGTSPSQLNLVNSSRLQSLRNKAAATANDSNSPKHRFGKSSTPDEAQDAELARLQLSVDRELAQLMAQFPVSKQRSLFRIRFGIDLDEFRRLPVQRAAEILKINPGQR